MGGMGCGVILLGIFVVLGFTWLTDNPVGIIYFLVAVAAIAGGLFFYRKQQEKRSVEELYATRVQLRALERGFTPLRGVALAMEKGEFAFYERDGVALLEYKSTGSSTSGGFAGGNVGITSNLSVFGGGFRSKTQRNPEESTVLDTGKVIFTNQRAVFVGPNQSREFEFDKLLDMNVEDNGFTVRASVSGRQRTSALRANAVGGLTPGFAFALAIELFKEGEPAAKAMAGKIATDIETQYRQYIAGTL